MDIKTDYDSIKAIADFIAARTKHGAPKVGIVCGTGFGEVADSILDADVIPYHDIPGFPLGAVKGHKGCFVIGCVDGNVVACMQGRVHPYEGYTFAQAALPIRVMKLLGVRTVILTNASGCMNQNFKVGDFMIIKDQIFFPGFSGGSPLFGPNDDRFGPRFQSLTDVYDKELRKLADQVGRDLGFDQYVRHGIYAMVGGPHYETPAELQLLHLLKADVVGMSTCHEAIVARHCDMRVFGFSLITNIGVTDTDAGKLTNHEEVLQVGKERTPMASKMLVEIVRRIK